jgi:L-lactate dehydrogenase complex protein LldG
MTGTPGRTGGLSARDEVLARLGAALDTPRSRPPLAAEDVPRTYQGADQKLESADREDLVSTLVGTLGDAGADVRRVPAGRLAEELADLLAEHSSVVLAAAGTPRPASRPDGPAVLVDDASAAPEDLEEIGAGVVRAAHAAAATGTLALSAATGGGRRAVSLVPDRLVVVLDESAVCYGLPRLVEKLGSSPRDAWTLVSGPSSTVDIGLVPVGGMHGPRRLDVVLVGAEPSAPLDEQPDGPHDPEETP